MGLFEIPLLTRSTGEISEVLGSHEKVTSVTSVGEFRSSRFLGPCPTVEPCSIFTPGRVLVIRIDFWSRGEGLLWCRLVNSNSEFSDVTKK